MPDVVIPTINERIRDHARILGFDDCRFTTASLSESGARYVQAISEGRHGEMAWLAKPESVSKRLNPALVLPKIKSVIALAISYYAGGAQKIIPIPKSNPQGSVARYAQFADYHEVVGDRLQQLTEFIQRESGPETRSLWYIDTGPILERDWAQRAGIGFIGKHTNLIHRKLGNWFFIGEILTSLSLPPDQRENNHCGHCTRCLEACPTQALPAPFTLDARRCISYLTIELKGSIPVELRPLIGNRIYGCDDCLAVCPWNRFAREGQLMKSHHRGDLVQTDLITLLAFDDASFKTHFAGTPILRTKRRGLLRNVCVALGNVGDENAIPALERATMDPEPLVAEHARWAIEEIRKRVPKNSDS